MLLDVLLFAFAATLIVAAVTLHIFRRVLHVVSVYKLAFAAVLLAVVIGRLEAWRAFAGQPSALNRFEGISYTVMAVLLVVALLVMAGTLTHWGLNRYITRRRRQNPTAFSSV